MDSFQTHTVLLRPTAKLLKALGKPWSGQLVEAPASSDDWYGNLLWIEGRKCILLTHAGTLFTIFVPEVPVADLRPPGRFMVNAICDALARADLPLTTFGSFNADDVQLAKTADRAVLGCMNDMAFTAEHVVLSYGGLATTNFGEIDRLLWNNINSTTGYTSPLAAVRELAARAGGHADGSPTSDWQPPHRAMPSPAPVIKKPPINGAEVWSAVAGRNWSYWDLWFCLVTVLDHAGDLGKLRDHFIADLRAGFDYSRRCTNEAKLSHLAGLEKRLDQACLTPPTLVPPEAIGDKNLIAKARKKVAADRIDRRAMTQDMLYPPRVVLESLALYGRWGLYPIDPSEFYQEFRSFVQVDHIPVDRTVSLTRRMSKRLATVDSSCVMPTERLALYRAFYTAGVDAQEHADDSWGEIGRMREDAWATFLDLDWRSTPIDPEDYWQDICGLRVWENYGLAHDHEADAYRQALPSEAPMIEEILLKWETDLRSVWLDYRADEARDQIAWFQLALGRFDHFEEAAARIGSESWQPIVAMVKAAFRAGRPEIAQAVFAAADRPGLHREYIANVRSQLFGEEPLSSKLQGDSKSRPNHLRIVR